MGRAINQIVENKPYYIILSCSSGKISARVTTQKATSDCVLPKTN